MADQLRIRQLLEAALDSNRTPEEVCRECPELLLEVREQWKRLRGVEAEIDMLFAGPSPKPGIRGIRSERPQGELPAIPGYDLEAPIGRGGMGVVYKARHLKLKRTIAIKMMLDGHAGPDDRERFMREAEAMASLRHPHIVQVHDVGEFEAILYFTMEFVEGGNLAQKLAGTPQPANQSATMVATLAEAIQVAHDSGIIHRDLKPANILLTENQAPKITDFGLARRLEGGPNLTLSGARLGTPSYMAPEQAIGKSGTIGPAADIYALGAILYEMLTGRPPFRAETAIETERQIIAEEAVPPSRLNAKVSRDLETICLKCLHKSPKRRYAKASALAEDLHHFLRLEPIEARRVGMLERSAKWVRRRPTLAAVVTSGILLAMTLGGGGLWLISTRAATVRAAEDDMREVAQLQRSFSWGEAGAALQRARARLGNGGPTELRRRLEQAGRDQDLVARLDLIRLKRAGRLEGDTGYGERDYEEAFREAGLCRIDDDPDVVATRVRASNVRDALVGALDDWALVVGRGDDVRRLTWLLAVARKADPDPMGWRDRFRDPAVRMNRDELNRLAESANVADTPVNLLVALGELLQKQGGDAIPFFKDVQRQHPNDFWANFLLAYASHQTDPADAVRFYQAALAIRPETPGLYNDLASALALVGRTDELTYYFRQAVRLDPKKAWYRASLGLSLMNLGRDREAVDQFQEGLALQPDPASLRRLRVGLQNSLMRLGRFNVSDMVWPKLLETNPPDHEAWNGYAEFCAFLGREDEYRQVRRALLDRFGTANNPNIAERVGRAFLLLPASDEELRKATALIDRAVADGTAKQSPSLPYFLVAKGLAEYRHGRPDRSISIMEGPAGRALMPAPLLIMAMARHKLGQDDEALKILAAAILSGDWRTKQADTPDQWIFHVLRREAEAMILPNLAAFLQGSYRPRNNDERMALLGVCQFKGLYLTAARTYAEVFAAAPKLSEDPNPRTLYKAAICAALAGSGRSEDGANLGEPERMRWRKQARDWLRADLESLVTKSEENRPGFREFSLGILKKWSFEHDLDGLRDPAAIEKFNPSERHECQKLWSDVDAAIRRIRQPVGRPVPISSRGSNPSDRHELSIVAGQGSTIYR